MQVLKIRVQDSLVSTAFSIILAAALSACGGGDEGSVAVAGLEAAAARPQATSFVTVPPQLTSAPQTPERGQSTASGLAENETGTNTQDDTSSPASAEQTSSPRSPEAGVAPEVPAWARGATYYVNPVAGSDANSGLSRSAPRRTLSNSIKMDGVTVLLKRGTTIELRSNLYPRDTYIGGYGRSAIKPRVVVPAGYDYAIGVDSGRFKISGIALVGNASTRVSAPGIGATKASSATIEECDIQDYANGISFSGTGSVIRNNRIARVTNNGINAGSTRFVAASESVITGNHIDVTGAAGDGITLHDGSGIGVSNKITLNTIVGANRENAIDVQGQYIDTLIEDNTMEGSGQYSIVLDDLNAGVVESIGTVIRRNRISNGTHAAIYARMPNVLISDNVIAGISSISGAAAAIVEASARILNNTVTVPAENTRSVFFIVQKPGVPNFGGEIRGNKVVNYSSQALVEMNAVDRQGMTDLWMIDENSYSTMNISGRWFMGMDFTQWSSGGDGRVKTFKDRRSTIKGL